MSSIAAQLGLDSGEELEIPRDAQQEIIEAQTEEAPQAPDTVTFDESAGDLEVSEPEDEPRQESGAQKRIRQEIERRKELQSQLDEQRQHMQMMEQRFAHLQNEWQQQTAPPEPQAPEFDEDPAAHLLHQQQKLQQQVERQTQTLQQQQQAAQQAQQVAAVQQHYEAMESQYAATQPDYYERIDGLKNQRLAQWQQLGLTPDQAAQRVQQEAWALVQEGLTNGRNPAEVFYQMAQAVPAPAPMQAPAEAAQPRARSIGSRGSSPRAKSLADYARMSDEDFAKATADPKAWRKIAGG